MIEIDPHRFYTVGIYAFGFMAIMNLASLFTMYDTMILFDIASRGATIVFNFALTGFFIYLRKQLPPKFDQVIDTDEEVIKMLGGGLKPKNEN